MKNSILIMLSLLMVLFGFCQSGETVWMHPNKGQWEDIILQKIDLTDGDMFVTRKGMTFHFHNAGKISHNHHHEKDSEHEHDEVLKGQVIHYHFEGANFTNNTIDGVLAPHYDNYYLGNDPSKWKGEVYAVGKSRLPNFLPGIEMMYDGEMDALKYSFLLQPNISPQTIKANIEGAEKITLLKNGNLSIQHRFGIIHESKPVAWQMVGDVKRNVEVKFVLNGAQLTYEVGAYDSNLPLVIDPSLTFSSFSGSTADNWGSTATPDDLGNVFGGGIAFATGFPVTAGAYDNSFNGTTMPTTVDVAITKFTANGASLIYSTYLGGSSSEFPASMVCGLNGELYVLGATGSSDFPMLGGYDMTYNGGPAFQKYTMNYNGSDMYITRFNANGTALLSSTYLGGTQNDGINENCVNYNYGDFYRGEISLDPSYNVYVTSSTLSSNFPTVGSGGQVYQGTQSAVAAKLNPTLSTLNWSRFISGSGAEAGMSIQIATTGNVFVAGGTTSPSLSFTSGYSLLSSGGLSDGFVTKLNGANGASINGTFIGTVEYDFAFFVQLDVNNDPYVLGQSTAPYAITPGKYGNANSGLFIRKFNNNLNAVQWTTMIGGGTGNVEVSPTAFLVSDCFDIYLAGWGSNLNNQLGVGNGSTTLGFPVTSDAYQPLTSGNDFYLMVLGNNASVLKYATFFGGTSTIAKHVDGGTSRFDKQGRVYHAVCASCGSTSGFTTTPGAWSTTNNSSNCNMAVFKFDLSVIVPLINVLDPLICYPDPVDFQNLTVNADQFFWDFGDGTTSTVQSPQHFFPGPGSYTVTLIASDSAGCYQADTSVYIIDIGDFQGGIVQPTDTLCIGESYQLQASGGTNYAWSPALFLDDSTLANPTATVSGTTVFTVIVSDSCGVDTLSATLFVYNDNPTISNDTSLCIGSSAPLWAAGGAAYSWSPATFLDDPNIATPICTPDTAITYTVTITTINNCVYQEQVFVNVFFNPPIPVIDDTVEICIYTSETINVSGSDTYLWEPSLYISPQNGPTVTLSPIANQYFICNFTNACGTYKDSVFAVVLVPNVQGLGDTIICPGDNAILGVTGGVEYVWMPTTLALNTEASLVQVTPEVNTTYQVIGKDADGCYDTSQVVVQLHDVTTVNTDIKIFAVVGNLVELSAIGTPPGGNFMWSPPDYLTCVNCATTEANPDSDFSYEVLYTDLNTCTAIGGVQILYQPSIYIPNTFTPDDDAFNGLFRVVPINVRTFKLEIYNRWGQPIHIMTETSNYWDGTYGGKKSPDGVYTWKIVYYDQYEKPLLRAGHITLIR